MISEFFKELFEYNHRMNSRLCEVLRGVSAGAIPNAERLFSHVLNAHQIWNNRIDRTEPDFGVWEILPPEKYVDINDANYARTLRILETLDPNETRTYKNSKGSEFTNVIRDVLFHIINHSTHHRGQIAAELRRGGNEPPASDYIFYKR